MMNEQMRDVMSAGMPEVVYEVNGQYMTEADYRAQERERLKDLHAVFARQRDEWVAYRAADGVEERWRTAQALYLGEGSEKLDDPFLDTLKNGPSSRKRTGQNQNRSKVVINIVRPKIDQAVARLCELLLPVDDRNWGIKPTPVPAAVEAMLADQRPVMTPDGQPTGQTRAQQAEELLRSAKTRAQAMEREIDDVLTECDYNGQQRKQIEEGVRLGTGLLLGPFPNHSTKRMWIPNPDGSMTLQLGNSVKPASMFVSCWDIWFDPACGSDHQRGQGFYHRRFVTKKELRDLVGLPGFDAEAIKEVLSSKPTRTKAQAGKVVKLSCNETSYEMWVYYGQVEPEDMAMLSEAAGDPLEDVGSGVIIMVGDTVIGATESWIADGSLPIDRWCWRAAEDSPHGYSLADEMVHQQRVVNAAWRQVMDDAKMSVGGQFVIKKSMIQPQDGSFELYPGKVWLASSELEDVRAAMHSFEFTNHSQQLLMIATSAMQFADQETSMPQLMGGEKGTAPETVGGMVMLSNNANTVQRMRIKLFDDSVTRPHLRRYFDWMMTKSTKSEIKGDMDVDARGSTALLEKDIQNQATLNLAAVTSNPRYQAFLDPKEELKVVLRAFKVNPEDIMLSDAQIEQAQQAQSQQPPPQDPRIAAAQLAMQGKQMEIADRQQQRAMDAQLEQAALMVKREGIAYNTERERAEAEQGMLNAQLQRELAIAKLNQDGVLTREEIQSKERLQAINLDVKTQLFNSEAALKVQQGSGI